MKILTVIGARPQFIKAAAVSAAINKYNLSKYDDADKIDEVIVHTGQHYDCMMSSVFFKELGLPSPQYNLNIGSGRHGRQTGEMLIKIEPIMASEKPDWVLVYGDTNSTLAGALTAAKMHIPIAHVESGLRSYNRKMPEEINRVVTDHLSTMLFCPSKNSVKNLRNEGIVSNVHIVGDVMCDSIKAFSEISEKRSSILQELKLKPKTYALATVHRAENTDDSERLGPIIDALEWIASNNLPIIMPLHPRTRKILSEYRLKTEKIRITEPVSYLDMLSLMRQARVILTDSGGMQKEACWLSVPCVTLRDETEWVELVQNGCNITAGTNPDSIKQAFNKMICKEHIVIPNVYGAGNASPKIVELLKRESQI